METLIAAILLSLLFGGIFGLIVGFVFVKLFRTTKNSDQPKPVNLIDIPLQTRKNKSYESNFSTNFVDITPVKKQSGYSSRDCDSMCIGSSSDNSSSSDSGGCGGGGD